MLVRQVLCIRCGRGYGTLYRVRDKAGKKTRPARYMHLVCPYVPKPKVVLAKDDVWAMRKELTANEPKED